MKLFIAAVALFAGAAAGVLVAQNTKAPQAPAKVTYMSAEQIAEALAKGGPALTPRAALITRDNAHMVAGGRRDVGGDAEMHDKAYDIVYITEGEAVYVTGGTLKNSKQTSPGEMLGGTIDGGEEHHLKKGDVMVVPPGIPHWWKDAKNIRYMIMKVNVP